jgi:ubiquinone/menaquinone biosynthesis C-methylase UbiE
MTTTSLSKPLSKPASKPIDYGFAPLRNAAWYKRAQAWVLSRGNRRYESMVAGEKAVLLASVSGTVLEIGPGGGVNLGFLRREVRWIGVEPNPFFHDRLRDRAACLGLDAEVKLGTAEALPVPDHSVDAVLGSLVLCSVRDPAAALREVRRVLRPGGRFVFLEHVAADTGSALRVAQRALCPIWSAFSDGCHPDRDTAARIAEAGFSRVDLRRFRLPIPIMGPHIAGAAWA